ncbi:MAG: hypothetical protein ACFB6S_09725 [Geminicoccaceae bacterium]
MTHDRSPIRTILLTFIIVSLWVNASEVFRYFLFVMPMIRSQLSIVPDVAPMNLPVFLIWGIWGSILVVGLITVTWLWCERFGYSWAQAVLAGTAVWLFVFVIFWLGLWNMNLTESNTPLVALPLAWVEMVVGALLTVFSLQRFGASAASVQAQGS